MTRDVAEDAETVLTGLLVSEGFILPDPSHRITEEQIKPIYDSVASTLAGRVPDGPLDESIVSEVRARGFERDDPRFLLLANAAYVLCQIPRFGEEREPRIPTRDQTVTHKLFAVHDPSNNTYGLLSFPKPATPNPNPNELQIVMRVRSENRVSLEDSAATFSAIIADRRSLSTVEKAVKSRPGLRRRRNTGRLETSFGKLYIRTPRNDITEEGRVHEFSSRLAILRYAFTQGTRKWLLCAFLLTLVVSAGAFFLYVAATPDPGLTQAVSDARVGLSEPGQLDSAAMSAFVARIDSALAAEDQAKSRSWITWFEEFAGRLSTVAMGAWLAAVWADWKTAARLWEARMRGESGVIITWTPPSPAR